MVTTTATPTIATATATTTTTTTTRSINSTRGFSASTFRAVSARYALLRFARGSARVVLRGFRACSRIQISYNILRRILLLGNLYIITLGTLRTFTWKTWEP